MKIEIETQKDMCGDEFLDIGTLTVEKAEGYVGLAKLESDGHEIYCDAEQLKKALEAIDFKSHT
jgi:hypothetical protein